MISDRPETLPFEPGSPADDPGRWQDLILFCAANPWHGVRFHDQHLAAHMAARLPVLYVDPPISPLGPLRHPELADSLRGPRLTVIRPNLAHLTPVAPPGPQRPGITALTSVLCQRSMRRAVRTLGGKVDTVVESSALLRRVGACQERLKVYWAQDDFVAGAELMGLSPDRVARGEDRVCGQVDLVIASNPLVAQSWRSRGIDTVLVPFGCDDKLFATTDSAPAAEDVTLDAPIVGFVGHLAERIDIRLLEAVADGGHSVLLVGPRHPQFRIDEVAGLLARPNVQWVGPKPFEALPSYLKMMDVGLVPYTNSAFNRGSFPLKTLEYLAAGRTVVATDLPAIRWLGSDLIKVASEPRDFAALVTAELARGRSDPLAEQCRRFAAQHSWDRRAQDFAEALGR